MEPSVKDGETSEEGIEKDISCSRVVLVLTKPCEPKGRRNEILDSSKEDQDESPAPATELSKDEQISDDEGEEEYFEEDIVVHSDGEDEKKDEVEADPSRTPAIASLQSGAEEIAQELQKLGGNGDEERSIDPNHSSSTDIFQESGDKPGGSVPAFSILMGDETDDESALQSLNRLRRELEQADNAHAVQSLLLRIRNHGGDRWSSGDSFTSDDFGASSTDADSVSHLSVNTNEEVDLLMSAVGRNEKNEGKRLRELEARARQLELMGNKEDARRIRESIEFKAKILETRRSALELLNRAVNSTSDQVGSLMNALGRNDKNEEKRLRHLEAQARRAEVMGDLEEAQRIRESMQSKSTILETRRDAVELLKRAVTTATNRASHNYVLERASSERDYVGDSHEMFPELQGTAPEMAVGPLYSVNAATTLGKGEWSEEVSSQTNSIPFLGDVHEEMAVGPPQTIAARVTDIVKSIILTAKTADDDGDIENTEEKSDHRDEEKLDAGKEEPFAVTFHKAPDPPGVRTVNGLPFFSDDTSESDGPVVHSDSSDDGLRKAKLDPEGDAMTLVDEEDPFVQEPNNGNQNDLEKEVMTPSQMTSSSKRLILIGLALLLVVIAAVVGGVVAGGNDDDDRAISPTRSPASPAAPPLTGERFDQLSTLLGSIVNHSPDSVNGTDITAFPSTPEQIKSLEWLAFEDPFQIKIGLDTADRIVDRYVLAMWYFTREDPDDLTMNDGTGTPWMSEWDVCFWKGVSCSDAKSPEVDAFRVERVDLAHPHGGTLPSEFGWMTTLQDLSMSIASLTGILPTQLGELSRLTSLVLHYNDLKGPIPSKIGALTKLRELHLDNNRLTGTIPESLTSLKQVSDLNLSMNRLTGKVPEALQGIGRDIVDLSGNNLAECDDSWYKC